MDSGRSGKDGGVALSDAGRRLVPRLESLGDNCEFGLVRRRLGDGSTGLFNAALVHFDRLIAFLRDDPDFFEFDDLRPKSPNMVTDRRVGVSVHSNILSRKQDGRTVWEQDLERRRDIHRLEQGRMAYLHRRFRERLRDPRTVLVVKRNLNLTDDEIAQLHDVLRARSPTGQACLLAVRVTDDAGRVGEADILGGGLVHGWIGRFAPYLDAKDAAYEDWAALINDVAGKLER